MTVITIDALYGDASPHALGTVTVVLVRGTGALAGTTTGTFDGRTWTTRLDGSGHATIDLTPNASLTPADTYYRISAGGLVRNVVVGASPADWDDETINVSVCGVT